MRPPGTAQDFLQYPLNELLGTPAHVRLLRFLATALTGPVAAPEAASHTGLTEAGARRALKRLAETGFVRRIGAGRAQQFCLREDDILGMNIRTLFEAEQERHESILARLKSLFEDVPEVRVAWIDDLPIEVGQALHIGVLADSRSLGQVAEALRRRVLEVERDFDLLVEIHAFSAADIPDVNWQTATLLAGVSPVSDAPQPGFTSHADLDARSHRIGKAIAEMLERDPTLLKRAQRHVERLSSEAQGPSSHEIREWKDILANYSRAMLKKFLVAETPRAQRLRQSSPFPAVLSPKQREELRRALVQDDS